MPEMKYRSYLRATRRRMRLRLAARGLLLSFSLVAAAGALLFAASRWTTPGGPAQSLLGLGFVLTVLVGGLSALGLPLLRRIPNRELLADVERLHPQLRERLSTTHYLLQHSTEAQKYRFSPGLVQETLDWAEREISPEYFKTLPDRVALRQPALAALGLALGWLALLLLCPGAVLRSASGYRAALSYATSHDSPWRIEIPGPLEVARGAGAEVRASISPSPKTAWIHLRFEGQPWQTRKMARMPGPSEAAERPGVSRFRYEVPAIEAAGQYYVSAEGHTSPVGNLRPMDPPRIEKFIYRVVPPAHTRLAVWNSEQTGGDLEAPQGATIELTLTTNNDLSQATLQWSNGEKKPMQLPAPRRAAATFALDQPRQFWITLRDRRGYETEELGPYELTTKADRSPQIFIHHPPLVSSLGAYPGVRVDWEAADDYGISQIDLFYQLNYMNLERRVPIARSSLLPDASPEQAAPLIFEPTSTLMGRFPWDLSSLDLLPGDEITFCLVAWDNDALRGPKAATSEVHLLRLPTASDLYEELQPQAVSQLDQLEEVLEQQRQIRQQAEQLRENIERRQEEQRTPGDLQRPGSTQWDDQQKVQQLSQEQQQLSEQLTQLQSDIQQTIEQLSEPNTFSVKTLTKMEQIRQLLDQLLTDEMKAVLNQFQQTLDQLAKDQPVEALYELEWSIEEFEESLDRTLALLENSLLDQQLEAMLQQAEALQQEQEALEEESGRLAEESREDLSPEKQEEQQAKQDELARQQEALAERTEALLEQMEQLARQQSGKNEELSESLRESLRQSEEQQLGPSQQDAAQELQKGQIRQAQSHQQQASQALSQLRQNLSAACEAMGGTSFERDLAELRRALDRALRLSERQEDVALRLNPQGQGLSLGGLPPLKSEIAIFQRYFRDETLRVEEYLRQLARQDPFLDFEAIRLLRLAARAMDRAVQAAENQSLGQVHNQARLALSEINSAILVLLDSLNSLSQAQASSSPGGYFQSLQQLIQRQRQLNEQTRRQDRRRGQVPDWQAQLQRLADEQAAIRRQTEELFRKYGRLEQLLQNLDQISGEMRDVEKQLEDQMTDAKVQEKQEHILTRLLDADKSLQERGTSKERQSETAGAFEPDSPSALPETLQRVRNRVQRLRQGSGMEAVPLEYQERVRHYFRSLSEESGWE